MRRRAGRLWIEEVALDDVVDALDGQPAWVVSHAAILAAVADPAVGGRVAIGGLGPPALMSLLAKAGLWAGVASVHELALARAAGFPVDRIVVDADRVDDGMIRDALTARVGVLERHDAEAARNVARIAAALGLADVPSTGGPRAVPADAFARVGGLLARVAAPPPELRLDAVWARASGAVRVLPISTDRQKEAAVRVTLAGLGSSRPVPAKLAGAVRRGDWVYLAAPDAPAARPRDPAHPMPRTVLVSGASFRVLEERPLPGDG